MKGSTLVFGMIVALIGIARAYSAEDEKQLSAILIPGQEWQAVAQDLSSADGLCIDANGGVIFCQMRAKPPAIYKLADDGTLSKIADGSRSGTRMGPDNKLYAVGAAQALMYELPGGAMTVLAEKISTNDLAVSHKGLLYLTEPGKKQITLIDPKTRQVRAVDNGITSPNGIALSPDQKTLYVSDYAGLNVWAFNVKPDGTLSDKKPLMTMKAPENRPTASSGDGMTVDADGRIYVTSAVGLQIFAPTGEALGILPKPKPGGMMSTTFGGKDLDYLYVSCGDTIYRRKTNTKGLLPFQAPAGESTSK